MTGYQRMTWFASLIWGEEEEAKTYLAGCWLMLDGRAMRLPPLYSGGSHQNGQWFIKRTTLLIPPRRLFVLMHISNVAFLSRFPANTSVAFERAKQRKICLDWRGGNLFVKQVAHHHLVVAHWMQEGKISLKPSNFLTVLIDHENDRAFWPSSASA